MSPTARAAVLVIAAALLPYLWTVTYAFAWDDHWIIRHVDRAFADRGLFGVLSAPFLPTPDTPNNYYRPLVYLTYLIDRSLGGGMAWVAHLHNVVLHAAVSLLVFLFARSVLNSAVGALAAALVFATHPIHVESVAWVAGRTDVLCALFSVASLLMWIRGVSVPPSTERPIALGSSALLLALACLSKEAAMILPLLFPLVAMATRAPDAVPPSRAALARMWIVTVVPAMAAAWLMRWAALRGELGQIPVTEQLRESFLVKEPAVAWGGLLHMLRWLVVPWPHNALLTPGSLVPDVVTFAAVGSLVAGALLVLRTNRILGAAVTVWIAGFSFPALLVYRSAVAAERYAYIPSIGLSLIVGLLVSRIGASGRLTPRMVYAGLGVVAVFFGAASLTRAGVWANDDTLSADLVRTSAGSSMAHAMRGDVLMSKGQVLEAIDSYARAAALEPRSALKHQALGRARLRAGDVPGAIAAFKTAVAVEPEWAMPHVGLAVACASMGDWACVDAQRRALHASPQDLSRLDSILQIRSR